MVKTPPLIFPTDRSKAVPLFQFFSLCASVVSDVAWFNHYLLLIFPSFGAWVGMACFVNVAFPGYLYLYLCTVIDRTRDVLLLWFLLIWQFIFEEVLYFHVLSLNMYSRTSMARTSMTRLQWLIRTRF